MANLTKIDEVANLWNKTRDPKYKEEWYKLIKEWNGINNSRRRDVSSSRSNETDDSRDRVIS